MRTPSTALRSARRVGVLAVAAALIASCSGSSDSDSEAGAPSTTAFQDEDNTVIGTVVLGDDVIIATEDGAIPPTSTEPSVEGTPDEPIAADATTTTAAPVPLPEPASVGRIVSLSATHTETLFALGLGEFVVAVDGESDFPEAALAVRDESLSNGTADLSTLLAFDPDVVVLGDDPTSMASRLAAEGVASYSGPQPDDLAGVYAQIVDVASIVGRPELGEDLVASMQADIAAVVDSLPAADGGRTFFHEIDPSLVTIDGGYLSNIYGELGLSNVAGGDATAVADGFVQLTNDQLLAADPSVILLADAECCQVTGDRVTTRPGWSGLAAVGNGAIVELEDDLILRWGPRVVDLIRQVGGAVIAAG